MVSLFVVVVVVFIFGDGEHEHPRFQQVRQRYSSNLWVVRLVEPKLLSVIFDFGFLWVT